ncbi:MAG TPA: DUF305 domain-containing protein [Candidatus Binatia bacterium]|nr:DUF305 domain-containing protein [Candidatus Binatia bacterium]
MNRRFILIATLIVLAAAQAQKHAAQSAMFTEHRITAPTGEFTASTDKTFDQLMDDAMNVMHKGMHTAPQTGDPDRDFVTMMIPHHQGAIDMAKVLLLYGTDEQLKRLAQEIIADQQNEVQLMQLWLAKHSAGSVVNRKGDSELTEEHHQ